MDFFNVNHSQYKKGGIKQTYLRDTARELRRNGTYAEKKMWKLLRNRQFFNLKFRRQHQIGPFIVDFYCDELRLILELDGEIHLLPAQRDSDRLRDDFLRREGFRIIRINNKLVVSDTYDRIYEFLGDELILSGINSLQR
ncbi:MAG: endonuclease domain-containing protein [Spirochaetales bacterium]|nr:endonuclease domain-containing protein [Spirochaetales bacterium]